MENNKGFTVTKSIEINRQEDAAIIGVKGYLLGKIYHLKSNQIIILGRDTAQCQIVIRGESVSRVHCNITYNSQTDDYTVRDTSLNGVVVDYKYRLKKNTDVRVRRGSSLCIGNDENEIILS